MKSKLILCTAALLIATTAQARDPDGKYAQANPELHKWFEGLRSGKGPCCSDADGTVVSDPDWQTQEKVFDKGTPSEHWSHYKVVVDGQWYDVPDDAVITEPNRIGQTMVWPIRGYLGVSIRCFMPGTMG